MSSEGRDLPLGVTPPEMRPPGADVRIIIDPQTIIRAELTLKRELTILVASLMRGDRLNKEEARQKGYRLIDKHYRQNIGTVATQTGLEVDSMNPTLRDVIEESKRRWDAIVSDVSPL